MMDNGGGEALVFFAVVLFIIFRLIIPSIISLFIVLMIKFFKSNLRGKSLLVLWFIFYIIVSLTLNWVLSPNFPPNQERIIKLSSNLKTQSR